MMMKLMMVKRTTMEKIVKKMELMRKKRAEKIKKKMKRRTMIRSVDIRTVW